ncbi:MAG: sigma-70 family RNA polymerase sigma factor [bacterium]
MDRKDFLRNFMQVDRPLRSYLMGISGNPHDADDMLQRVWQTLWEKLDEFDEKRSFRAWAFGFARLQALKWRQSKARSREVLSEEIVALLADTVEEATGELDQRREFLAGCVQKMGSLQRSVLQMKYVQCMISRDIGERIGRSVPAVDMMLMRLRRMLRECVESRLAEVSQTP